MMNNQFLHWLLCLCVSIWMGADDTCKAQNASFELWPEADIWYRLSPAWRLSAFVPVTKYHESKDRDLNLYLQADYSWGRTRKPYFVRMVDENRQMQMKGWMARIGVMEGWSLEDQGESYTEDMIYPEIHKRLPLKGRVLLSQRFRTDFRWLGQEPQYSYRFRYRIMVEKEYQMINSSLVPYVNLEPYWDSRYSTFNRIRAIGGATVQWHRGIAVEGNLTYQYDSKSSVTNVYAFNIILHVFFEKRQPAPK